MGSPQGKNEYKIHDTITVPLQSSLEEGQNFKRWDPGKELKGLPKERKAHGAMWQRELTPPSASMAAAAPFEEQVEPPGGDQGHTHDN